MKKKFQILFPLLAFVFVVVGAIGFLRTIKSANMTGNLFSGILFICGIAGIKFLNWLPTKKLHRRTLLLAGLDAILASTAFSLGSWTALSILPWCLLPLSLARFGAENAATTWYLQGILVFGCLFAGVCAISLRRKNGKFPTTPSTRVLSVSILLLFGGLLFGSIDANPVDDAAFLAAHAARPPDAENAYVSFTAATNFVHFLPRKPLSSFTPEEAQHLVATHATALVHFHAAANRPCWYDLTRESAPCTFDTYFQEFVDAERLARLEIKSLLLEKRVQDAIETARDLARFADLLQRSGGHLFTGTAAHIFRNSSAHAVMEIASTTDVSDAQLTELQDILSLTEPAAIWNPRNLIPGEYAIRMQRLEVFARALLPSVYIRYMFHPNRTRQAALQFAQSLVQRLDKPNYEPTDWNDYAAEVNRAEISCRGPIGRNILGAFTLRTFSPAWNNFAAQHARSEFIHAAARLTVAIEAYRRRQGERPALLDQLVPDHLAAVPSDPFDISRPINYAPQAGILWTVGKDRSCLHPVKTKSKTTPYGSHTRSVIELPAIDRPVRLRRTGVSSVQSSIFNFQDSVLPTTGPRTPEH